MSFDWTGFQAHNGVEPGKFLVFTNETAHYGFSITFEMQVPDGVPAAVRQQICEEIVNRLMPEQERRIPAASDTAEGTVAIGRMIHSYTR
jgi:hypothetical protein